MTETDVAVDGGQSGMRIAVVDHGQIRHERVTEGFAYRPTPDAVDETVRALVAEIAGLGPIGRICLGLTNAPSSPVDRRRLALALARGAPAARVLVTSDMVTAHCGALAGGDGVVIAAGTGAVCLGTWQGACARADGFGYLLGDDGSGFAIARAGLAAALRAEEQRGPATTLVEAARNRYADVDDFPYGLYRADYPVRDIARFALDVAEAARAGDRVAQTILSDAIDQLVESVASVIGRCPGMHDAPAVPVSYVGGLMANVEQIVRPFTERVQERIPQAIVQPPRGDGLAGAIRLLTQPAPRYGDLVASASGDQL